MAQGQFTKEEAKATAVAFEEILAALPKPKKMNFFGHASKILIFLDAAERAAPAEVSLHAVMEINAGAGGKRE